MASKQSGVRQSSHISGSAARNVYHASRYAKAIGGAQANRAYPQATANAAVSLNLLVTIDWSKTATGIDNFHRLRNQRFCRWLRTRGIQLGRDLRPHYIYSREQQHVHWEVHMPEELIEEFKDLLPRWITSLENTGTGPRKRSINTAPTMPDVVDVRAVNNTVGLRNYLLKGIDPRQAHRFGVKRTANQGIVTGRRTGVSRSLGSAARKAAGYLPRPAVWRRGKGKSLYSS